MSIADELQKLEQLRRSGALSDAEYAQAKAAVLAGTGSPGQQALGDHLSDQLAEVRYQNELARLDRAWEMEREKYMLTDRDGGRQLPTPGLGIGMAVVGGIFGVIWTVFAMSITSDAPDFGGFSMVKVLFPLFGVLFTLGAIGYGIYCMVRGQ